MTVDVSKYEEKPNQLAYAKKQTNWIKRLLISVMFLYLGLFLLIPLVFIFAKAFEQGAAVYFAAITESDALSAIKLTILVALITVPLIRFLWCGGGMVYEVSQFRGKQLLLSLIELPFAVSPVIAGLVFVLFFSPRGAWSAFDRLGYKNNFLFLVLSLRRCLLRCPL